MKQVIRCEIDAAYYENVFIVQPYLLAYIPFKKRKQQQQQQKQHILSDFILLIKL